MLWEEQLHYVCVTTLNYTANVKVVMTGNGHKHTVTLHSSMTACQKVILHHLWQKDKKLPQSQVQATMKL